MAPPTPSHSRRVSLFCFRIFPGRFRRFRPEIAAEAASAPVAVTHTLERPTSGALRHPAVTKPYFGFRFKQPPKEGAGDVVAG